ncbi:MAG: UDP-N-acetylglucosamine 2-epimerase (non-hydrolyzing), partial [Bacteroidetes bacterium]|nr:UDP-N-acetylglucosamine 2-epimerase (non-hydrolyzing) [Bacteroidota bacterium]
ALLQPCVTVRPNTERPVTVDEGTNILMELDAAAIAEAGRQALAGEWKEGRIPEKWDGHASERIAAHLADHL